MASDLERERAQETSRLIEAGIRYRIQDYVMRALGDDERRTSNGAMWMAVKTDIRSLIISPLQKCGLIEDCMFDITIWTNGFVYVETRMFWPSVGVTTENMQQIRELERRVAQLEQAANSGETFSKPGD